MLAIQMPSNVSCTNALILQGGRTSLMEALSGGSIECVKLLLDRGAKINQQDKVSIFQIRQWVSNAYFVANISAMRTDMSI